MDVSLGWKRSASGASAASLYAWVLLACGICAVLDESDADLRQDALQSFVKARIVLHAAYSPSYPSALFSGHRMAALHLHCSNVLQRRGNPPPRRWRRRASRLSRPLGKRLPSQNQFLRRRDGPWAPARCKDLIFDINTMRCIQRFCSFFKSIEPRCRLCNCWRRLPKVCVL